jgi:type IX secretion system PorP/SprF family membrane protein
MKKILFLSLVSFIYCSSVKSQDIHFSQADLSPTFYNPAAAGAEYGNLRVNTIYKDQWKGQTDNPFTTYYFGADYGFYSRKNGGKKAYVGLGMNAFYDKAGIGNLTSIDASALVSINIPLSKTSRLSVGSSIGFSQRRVNDTQLYSWGNAWEGSPNSSGNVIYSQNGNGSDGVFSSQETFSANNTDIGIGVYYTYAKEQRSMRKNDERRLDLGFSVSHLTEPDMSFFGTDEITRSRKYTFYSEFSYGLNYANTTLKPLFVFNQQGVHQEILAGLMFDFELMNHSRHTGYIKESSIGFGAYYRVADALIFAARFEMGRVAVSYSYDATLSKLPSYVIGRGGSEISLSFALPNPNGKRSRYGRTYF